MILRRATFDAPHLRVVKSARPAEQLNIGRLGTRRCGSGLFQHAVCARTTCRAGVAGAESDYEEDVALNRIYVPATSAEQWKQFLADPEKQWRQGYSARTLAYSWQEAKGFPPEVQAVLSASPHFQDIELLHANPEHQV